MGLTMTSIRPPPMAYSTMAIKIPIYGDGKIFVYELMDVVRIRTGEHGEEAVWDSEQKKAGKK